MALSELEAEILQSIVVASENDPEKPEFPPGKPKFPATPTYQIKVPWFSNVWLKDESYNPTGTHKDRMAWEIVVTYRKYLQAKRRGKLKGDLPQMSIISSGTAAVAVQTMLRTYNLPNLKVLLDFNINQKIIAGLEKIGCEVYTADLSRAALSWGEILALTHNQDGVDITSDEALGPTTRFYDWLSYELINSSPDFCFIPFGSGQLFENIVNINAIEISATKHDPRFSGDVKVLRQCNFMGATTNFAHSKADKLYSHHLPFAHFNEQWIRNYRIAQSCGQESDVYVVKEPFLIEAMRLARAQKVKAEHSGIAGLALLLQMANQVPKNAKILIVNTGKTKLPRLS